MSILGIDIGGTKTTVLFGGSNGLIFDRFEFPTNSERGPEAFANDILHAVAVLRSQNNDADYHVVSISVGGPLDDKNGILLNPPHLKGLHNLDLKSFFGNLFRKPVCWMHDARACGLAEWRLGYGKDKRIGKLVHLTFATGFGCGVIYQGRPMDIAGEIGHWFAAEDGPEMFGKKGSVEGVASGAGIMAMASRIPELNEFVELPDLAFAAKAGNQKARDIFTRCGKEVGRVCGKIIDLFSPDVITLGTLAFRIPELVMEPILQAAEEEALPNLFKDTVIVPSVLAAHLGDVSSLSAAYHHGYNVPDQKMGISARVQLQNLTELNDTIMKDHTLVDSIDQASIHVIETLKDGGKILTAGNGGSATDASHLAEELIGRYSKTRKPLPAIHLGADAGAMTCIANDFGFEEVYARQVEALGEWGDILVVFSTSGNSPNILKAIQTAKRKKVFTIALLGKDGGEAAQISDHSIIIPHQHTARIQEIHTLILHAFCEACDHFFTTR